MIKIQDTQIHGWEPAIRGMRNPMNSWDKSDSHFNEDYPEEWLVGKDDISLMKKLTNAGTDHSKFMRMITVYADVLAPLYWWKEYDTYKVGTVANSCSTMHKIHSKEFTLDDFSHEHLLTANDVEFGKILPSIWLNVTITLLNQCRKKFIETKDKRFWYNMIQVLPSSYNQKRTIMLNYQVLYSIYKARKDHKLDEWHDFCDWILTLPHFKEITGE